MVLSGVPGANEKRNAKQHELDQAYSAAIKELADSHEDKLAEQLRSAQQDWNQLSSNINQGNLPVQVSFTEQSLLIFRLLALSRQIDDGYGLSQDPDVPTVSGLQFKRGNLLETVLHALEASGLPAHHLELELTESILLQDIDTAIQMLYSLSEMGVKLSIDDFGTGYSSLSYLKRLAVNKLKIDQSFVRDLVKDPDDAAIVKAIIQLGHNLQLAVIAEGVETTKQLTFLQNYGCDEAQGYLIGRPVPVPVPEFTALCSYSTSLVK